MLPVVFVSLVLAVAMAFGVQQLQACVASRPDWGPCLKDLTGVPEIKADDPKAAAAGSSAARAKELAVCCNAGAKSRGCLGRLHLWAIK
jgi:hypothetical protein